MTTTLEQLMRDWFSDYKWEDIKINKQDEDPLISTLYGYREKTIGYIDKVPVMTESGLSEQCNYIFTRPRVLNSAHYGDHNDTRGRQTIVVATSLEEAKKRVMHFIALEEYKKQTDKVNQAKELENHYHEAIEVLCTKDG